MSATSYSGAALCCRRGWKLRIWRRKMKEHEETAQDCGNMLNRIGF